MPHRVEALRDAGCHVSVVVVEPTAWSPTEVADFVGADVLAVLPHVAVARGAASRRCGRAPGGRGGGGSRIAAAWLAGRRSPVVTPVTVGEVRLEEVIEAVQEALVTAEAGGDGSRWDDLEREAFAHDVATSYVARRARAAIEAGSSPMELAAENDLIRRAIAAYFHAGKFQALLDIDGVTDIMVNAHDAIWLQRVDGAVERYREPIFADADDLRAEVAHLARRAGGTERRFDDAKPMLVLRLPDGSRLAAIMNVSTGAAGRHPPQRAARRLARPARGAGHDRPGDALAARRGDAAPACASSCRARPAPARRRWCGR